MKTKPSPKPAKPPRKPLKDEDVYDPGKGVLLVIGGCAILLVIGVICYFSSPSQYPTR